MDRLVQDGSNRKREQAVFDQPGIVRAAPKAWLILTVLVMGLGAPLAPAQADPVLDGNIDDVLLLANQNIANGSGEGIIIHDPERDICFTDTLFLPCDGVLHTSATGNRFYDNGFDIALVGLAVVGDQTWIGMRVSGGNIGDTDGDGTDSSGVDCPARETGRMPEDPSGIGAGENYRFRLDTNCDGVTDIIIFVRGGAGGAEPVVSVTDGGGVDPVPVTSAEARFAGTDLEIEIHGLSLPTVFSLNALAGSTFSGMSLDECGPSKTNAPTVEAVLESQAPPDSFVFGQPEWVILHLTNQSRVPIDAWVADLLPSDWRFTGNTSGDLLLNSAQGGQLIFSSPTPVESTAVCRFEVIPQLGGVSEENRAVAWAAYACPCLAEPVTALTDTVRAQWSATMESSTTSASPVVPATDLGWASPNPFQTSTRIWFTLGGSEAGHVRVSLYDAAGRLVRTLIDGSRAPGRYDLTWDGRRDDGSAARGGVYFARAWLGERGLSISRRVLYLR